MVHLFPFLYPDRFLGKNKTWWINYTRKTQCRTTTITHEPYQQVLASTLQTVQVGIKGQVIAVIVG
jgi:hypothetical protein